MSATTMSSVADDAIMEAGRARTKHTSGLSSSSGTGRGASSGCSSTQVGPRSVARVRGAVRSESSACQEEQAAQLRSGQGLITSGLMGNLRSLSGLLQRPLQAAQGALGPADEDLADPLALACAEARAWVWQAGAVLSSFALAAEDLARDVLPNLEHAAARGKHHSASSLLGVVQGKIHAMRCEASDVLSSFGRLRERVSYLARCTDMAVVCELMYSVDCRRTATSSVRCLEAALSDLNMALDVMEPSAEFWQGFLRMGEGLFSMARSAQGLRAELCKRSGPAAFPAEYSEFCAALRGFCCALLREQ